MSSVGVLGINPWLWSDPELGCQAVFDLKLNNRDGCMEEVAVDHSVVPKRSAIAVPSGDATVRLLMPSSNVVVQVNSS